MNHYDVIIVGAGPAGCACAIHCARYGLKVAIIERQPSLRERPGETLHPGIEPLLRQLGVAQQVLDGGFIRPLGNWVTWQHERSFVPFGNDANGPWRGFQIPRSTLDSLLLEKAKASGVNIMQPRQAKRVIMQGRRIIGIQTETDSLYCRQLIDASGAHAWLTRQLGLGVHRHSAPLMAFYGYLRASSNGNKPTEGIFADESGWYWVADLGAGLYNWTRLYFAHQVDKVPTVPLPLAGFEPSGKVRGADVTWKICAPSAGEGYFIIGDAAAMLDPGASHGVLKALMSGIMAAHGIIEGGIWPAHQEAISRQYHQWLQEGFENDTRAMRELYQAHPFPPAWLGWP